MTVEAEVRSTPTIRGRSERWDDIEIRPEGDPLPCLPPGTVVDVRVVCSRVFRTFDKGWRAELTCEVVEEGQYFGARLPLFFKLPAREGDRGPFKPVARGSKYYKLWTFANGNRKPLRRDRMPLAIFRDRLFRARTKQVTHDWRGRPAASPFSIVEELVP